MWWGRGGSEVQCSLPSPSPPLRRSRGSCFREGVPFWGVAQDPISKVSLWRASSSSLQFGGCGAAFGSPLAVCRQQGDQGNWPFVPSTLTFNVPASFGAPSWFHPKAIICSHSPGLMARALARAEVGQLSRDLILSSSAHAPPKLLLVSPSSLPANAVLDGQPPLMSTGRSSPPWPPPDTTSADDLFGGEAHGGLAACPERHCHRRRPLQATGPCQHLRSASRDGCKDRVPH